MAQTPTTWLPETMVNPNTSDARAGFKVIGLSNGNILVAYTDQSDVTSPGAGQDISGVIYDAEGSVVRSPFQLNTAFSDEYEYAPSIAATNDGGFVLAYATYDGGAAIYIERHDAAGDLVDSASIIDTNGNLFGPPSVQVDKADNSVFVTFRRENDDTGLESIRGQKFGPDLVASGAERVLATDALTSAYPTRNDTAVLVNGTYVTVFQQWEVGDDYTEDGIGFRMSNADGSNGLAVSITEPDGDPGYYPKVSALPDGGFVVVWQHQGFSIAAQIFNSDGSERSGFIDLGDGESYQSEGDVVGLEDGTFFVVWQDVDEVRLRGQLLDGTTGAKIGDEIIIGDAADTPYEPELGTTTDGRILVTYFTYDSDGYDDIQFQILDPRELPIQADVGDGQVTGLKTDSTILGSSVAETLFGQDGNDQIDGKGGADTMFGRLGNDTFFVNNANDQVIELKNGGDDTVKASVTFDLLAGVHVEHLSTTNAKGTGSINLYGNSFKQEITGNAGANFISDGGTGAADTLRGLGGNDTYRVYNSATKIVESASQGANDTVLAAVTFDLVAGVFVETMATTNAKGTAKINLYGNEVAQKITGNAGANILSDGGKGGSDTLVGLGGNDTFRVYNSGTKIVEAAGGGSDTVEAAVDYTVGKGVYIQVLETTNAAGTAAIGLYSNEFGQTVNGNAGNNSLRGYGGNDKINGGAGADRISGGLGNDTLAGNTGADIYYFSYALDEATNLDTIKGFSSIDLISLNSSVFTKAGPAGALAASAFRANTSGKAGDASDRIIWETDTGRLYYDPDGTGAAAGTAFAVITGNTGPMNAGDFVIT
ncbi:MAG: calcium-binding protein [Rhizobiaceae bacterium]|nr:calcium-binding protein [Rhizobiaceae bacterium]